MSSVAAEEAASSEGPVLSLMSKRLRALRKKYNRITQMEERVAEGKPLNKEQEEVLRSKTAVAALIDEYEKLRLPLSSALHDELSRLSTPSPSPPEPSDPDETLEDLVGLLYFGCLFDVKPQAEFTATMLARTHERGCCLTYDYVTDEATELLGERDLDAISSLGALVTSRPASSGVSHKNALRGCVEQAKLWLRRSDQPIHQGASITYAGLREKLSKIMASDYFTTTPEMKAPVDVAAAVGKYNTSCQVQVSEPTMVPAPDVQSDGSPALYQHKEDEQDDFQAAELVPDQSSPVDEHPEDEADMPNALGDITSSQEEQQNQTEPDVEEQNQRNLDQKEQQSFPRRGGYQNPRGGIRGGGGGGRRGYPNGRGGGRGGRGGYQNGRNQYFDPGYYPRNYYNTRGRGGRSGGGPAIYNNHGGAAGGGGHVAENAE